ncbi:MAG: SDR family NAD(P)-dependent oxidoreductase [Arcobacteraceae bacterium]
MNLTNKTILITGANGGVGSELLDYALKHDALNIYCTARNTNDLLPLSKKHSHVKIFELDITNKKSIKTLVNSIGNIDILINNAGVNSNKRVCEDTTIDFEVNLLGTLNMCQAFKGKINEGGSLVNITSFLALVNLPIMGLYCASKSALHSLTQAFRAELASQNILVQEVLPGPIDTRMTQGQQMPKATPQAIVEAIFEGIQSKADEIFPDDFSKIMYQQLLENPKKVEKEFAQSVQG